MLFKHQIKCWLGYPLNLRIHIDEDLSIVKVKEASHETSPLDDKWSNEEIEAQTAEAVSPHEGHQEAKANKHHHMHILENCKKKKSYLLRTVQNFS